MDSNFLLINNEMEANTNFCLQNQITELKAELEKITRPSSQHIKGD